MFLIKNQNILSYFTLYDVTEIVLCMLIMHIVLSYLYKKQGSYAYTLVSIVALCMVSSWVLSSKIISSMIALAAACYYGMLLVPHEEAVQPSVHSVAYNHEGNSWIETIFSISIQAFHENVSLIWIIDIHEQLHEILHAEITLHAYLVPKLSDMIIHTVNPNALVNVLWVNKSGYLIGINPYKGPTNEIPSYGDIIAWSKQKKIIMIQSHAQKRMYSFVHDGAVRENLSSHHAYHTIKHILNSHPTSCIQEAL